MSAHNPFATHPKLPDVERGMVLGFVCPGCRLLSEKYVADCGCYACVVCHSHVETHVFEQACESTAELVNRPSRN